MGAYDELDKFQTEEGRKIVSAFVAKALADEQQPADVVTAEQQQDGAVGRACSCEPGWQCVECVSDDEFRFEPLGRPTEES